MVHVGSHHLGRRILHSSPERNPVRESQLANNKPNNRNDKQTYIKCNYPCTQPDQNRYYKSAKYN